VLRPIVDGVEEELFVEEEVDEDEEDGRGAAAAGDGEIALHTALVLKHVRHIKIKQKDKVRYDLVMMID
jgi:hypothetical protein